MSGSGSRDAKFRAWHVVTIAVATPTLYAITWPFDPSPLPIRELLIFTCLWAFLSQVEVILKPEARLEWTAR